MLSFSRGENPACEQMRSIKLGATRGLRTGFPLRENDAGAVESCSQKHQTPSTTIMLNSAAPSRSARAATYSVEL